MKYLIRQSRRRIVYAVLAFSVVLLFVSAGIDIMRSQNITQLFHPDYPTKIALDLPHNIPAGRYAQIKVLLMNAAGKPVAADNAMNIAVKVLWPSGKDSTFIILVPRGAEGGNISIPMNTPGLCTIKASEPQLLAAGGYVVVTQTRQAMRLLPERIFRSPDAAGGQGGGGHSDVSEKPVLGDGSSLINAALNIAHEPLADGTDFAEVVVYSSEPMRSDLHIQVSANNAIVSPEVLVIPKDSVEADLIIRSSVVGVSNIHLEAHPEGMPELVKDYAIHFMPAITGLKCSASPSAFSLFDDAAIVVSLVDKNGTPLNAAKQKNITLLIDVGKGELTKNDLTIDSGKFDCSTTFTPTKLGSVKIVGMTDMLHPESVVFSVGLPYLTLVLTIVGGLAGGFIAKIKSNYEHWRVLIGVVTGFILYWALSVGLLNVISHQIMLNPFSALAVSVIGGWAGTEVFSALLSQFGIIKKPS